jgi:hypothetical protein
MNVVDTKRTLTHKTCFVGPQTGGIRGEHLQTADVTSMCKTESVENDHLGTDMRHASNGGM